MKKYKNLVECIHCGAENPPTAYCCLSCFKVLKSQPKTNFWRVRIEPTVTALAVIAAVTITLAVLLKHWMENIDAEVTMNLKTAENSYSITADKKKRNDLEVKTDVQPLEETPSEK